MYFSCLKSVFFFCHFILGFLWDFSEVIKVIAVLYFPNQTTLLSFIVFLVKK